MSLSTIVTYPGRSALERAADRWGTTLLPPAEEARHRRMMNAIRNIKCSPDPVLVAESEPAAPDPGPALSGESEPWAPGCRWRYLQHEQANELRQQSCWMCLGTGELTVEDGHGGVDFDLCPRCQKSNPYRRTHEISDVSAF